MTAYVPWASVSGALLLAAACGGTGGAGEIRSNSQPEGKSSPTPEVGTVSVDGGPPEAFLLKSALLRTPRSAKVDRNKVNKVLSPNGPPLRYETLFGNATSTLRNVDPKAITTARGLEAPGQTVERVTLSPAPRASTREVGALVATDPDMRGHKLVFNSEQARNTFELVSANRKIGSSELSLEFVVDATGLLLSTEEGANFLGMRDENWWTTNLVSMWPLALAAQPPPELSTAINVFVVDQGIIERPFNTQWSGFVGKGQLDVAGTSPGYPYHGTDCASVIGARVNDGKSAAGTCLFAPDSSLPDEPTLPPIRLFASVLPAGVVTVATLAEGIRASVAAGADVINASYFYRCGRACMRSRADRDLLEALEVAETHDALVVFGAGNEGKQLARNSSDYVVGCQRNGLAVCVGATGPDRRRQGFSNWGDGILTFAPGINVAIGELPIGEAPNPEGIRMFRGTSASAAFMSGILALAKAAWGVRYSNAELRNLIATSSFRPDDSDVEIIDAAALLRQKLILRKENRRDDTLDDVRAAPVDLPDGKRVYTLESDNDTDLYPLSFDSCTRVTLESNYVADTALDTFSLRVLDGRGRVVFVAQGKNGRLQLNDTTLNARVRYYLEVSNVAQGSVAASVAAATPRSAAEGPVRHDAPTDDGPSKGVPTAYDLKLTTAPCDPAAKTRTAR